MRLNSSPIRKSPTPLRSALRALVVSACALTPSAAPAHPGPSRRTCAPPPATAPYLALLSTAPLRFASPELPPAKLAVPPLPEEIAALTPVETPAEPEPDALSDLTPLAEAVMANGLPDDQPTADSAAETEPVGPPPIILPEDTLRETNPVDILPFFRLPSAPSRATFRQQ